MDTELLTGIIYVKLTQGKVSAVDAWLNPLVCKFKWKFDTSIRGGYAKRTLNLGGGKYTSMRLHRFIWESVYGAIPSGYELDHINGDRLDNRLGNLRLVTHRVNVTNTIRRREGTTTSQYVGVRWHKASCKWVAHIGINRKQYYLGIYPLEEDASAAYQTALNNYNLNGVLPNERRNM